MGDPDFCEKKCPICTRARQGNRLARFVQAIEMLVTFGGCPHGRARQKEYGVRPNEPVRGCQIIHWLRLVRENYYDLAPTLVKAFPEVT